MGIFKEIVQGIGKLLGGVDELVTSEEERLQLKARLTEIMAPLISQGMQYEQTLLEAQSRIITAEAQSDNFLTANWRPFSMLVMLALLCVFAINGDTPPEWVQSTFKIGFGGYVGGRSVEKVAKTIAGAMKEREK